ncbi:MAG: tyrosine-protein phosphatase [Chloroflexi bacterium]|nr:tyrosine-protein phosphatase [Chloroflexota bacterium]
MTALERAIPFQRVYNFRDLGGYAAADGRVVRWRRLFRSGELQRMSDDEARACRDSLRIATVIDLRSHDESNDPRGFGAIAAPPARRHHLPIGNARSKYEARESGRWDPAYVPLLEHHGDTWASAVRLLSTEDAYPALFHCVTGKDRTGVLAALLLGVLGVPDRVIVEDYAVSQQAMDLLVERLRASGGIAPGQEPNPALGVVPSAMMEMLAAVSERYGSPRGFLRRHGVTEAVFARLEGLLLEEPAGA